MKKGLRTAVPLLFCCLLLTACGAEDLFCNSIPCALDAGQGTATEATLVNYAVVITGSAVVDQIVYWDAAGVQVTVPGPITESWSLLGVAVTTGNNFGLTVAGSADLGVIVISYSATDTSSTVTGNDSCEQYCW